MAPSSFRAKGWDPLLIIAQIVSLQSVYYITISILLLLALALTGDELSLDAILNDNEIRTDTVFGWTLALVWVVNAAISIPVIVFLIQRAKLVLDFVATLHGIHMVLIWSHTGHFPTCGAWWVLQVVSIIGMTLGGEWACMQREMEPILVTSGNKNKATRNRDSDNNQQQQQQAPSSSSTTAGAAGASSSSSSNMIETEQEDWVHLSSSSKKKRKTSDVSSAISDDEQQEQEQQAPFTRVVGKARQALVKGAQRATSGSKGKLYDIIPMKDVDGSSS
ncbi:hypothetical protein O0I10_004514 [Lichtheimia ornata]|uniref:Integral membrane protein n=1 Tax=Lichtheimia ornata TaxID=688661 RepID=A0AAD7V991_9FUNG|nr:uncharacterized protein O0I10_004514 [Lichtheimia ornata]KAJ8659921.1 hypothetical protein O0I10_004514 [Lichtheimia ornata]